MTFDDLPLSIQQAALKRWPQINRIATRVLWLDPTHKGNLAAVPDDPFPALTIAPPIPIASAPLPTVEVVTLDRYRSPWSSNDLWMGYASAPNVLVVKYSKP